MHRPKLAGFDCARCGTTTPEAAIDARCAKCRGPLIPSPLAAVKVTKAEISARQPGVWRYKNLLPDVGDAAVTLGEGGTPLLPARRIGAETGFNGLAIKDETRNPTGSFIDRGATVLVSIAKREGVRKIVCTTTGNLGASISAYAAKAEIEAKIGIHANIDAGKLYQMIAYGARIEMLSRPGDLPGDSDGLFISAANHYLLEGEKTTAFEIVEDGGWREPDAIVIPVGTGGHLTMTWRALAQLHDAGLIPRPSCKLVGVQLQSPPAPRLSGRTSRGGRHKASLTELEESEPSYHEAAAQAIRDSHGIGVEITAREAIRATSDLAKMEGIFAEPASASVIAALDKIREERIVDRDSKVVCIITGAGLKDTKMIARLARTPKHVVTRERLLIRPVQLGPTKLRILLALEGGSLFGYAIWKSLNEEMRITIPSIYQHMSELEGIDLVKRSGTSMRGGRERVFYELTSKGKEALRVATRKEVKRLVLY